MPPTLPAIGSQFGGGCGGGGSGATADQSGGGTDGGGKAGGGRIGGGRGKGGAPSARASTKLGPLNLQEGFSEAARSVGVRRDRQKADKQKQTSREHRNNQGDATQKVCGGV